MRIGIAGIHNAASTFSQHRADTDFFELTRGAELVAHYRLDERIGAAATDGIEWIPFLRATSGAMESNSDCSAGRDRSARSPRTFCGSHG